MRIKLIPKIYSFVLICILSCSGFVSSSQTNQLNPEEKKQGFKLLFDGKSLDLWRNYKSKTIRPQWQVIDGAMVLTEKGGRDIVTKEKFDYFDFRLQWTIAEGGNSGIMFRVDESTTKRLPWMVAPEFQLYDSYTIKGKPERSAGALYGLVGAPKGITKKIGEWNNARILLAPPSQNRGHLQFWLNGTKTIDLVIDHAPGSEWSKLITKRNAETKGTKFELPAEFFKTETGPILLQDHGARVAFRNIRIRKLPTTALSTAPKTKEPGVIPRPVSAKYSEGFFTITPATRIVAEDKAAAEAQKLIDTLAPAMNFRLKLVTRSRPRDRTIRLELSDKLSQIGNEGYTLDVTEKNIVIRANQPAGLFYGIQTLRQLLPVSAFSKTKVESVTWKVPCVKITDYPRFKWRGLLVDPARHFIPKPALLRFIDTMSLHKLNSLQIHLTDDQGWRIEINKYPQLTKIGAFMDFTTMRSGGTREEVGDQHPGGFYTQDDISQLVRYSAERYITIVPEIEMPAHTGAAIVSYPNVGLYPNRLNNIPPDKRWTANERILAPRPKTVAFMQDVLTEVMGLFPGRYIHIGGDEANKDHWKRSEEMQALILRFGLKDEAELHSWFIKQMDTFLAKHGRRLVGWDDILQGGLAPGAVVMSWRGEAGGISSANAGHDVVMAPTSHTYFDYYQGPAEKEPLAIGGYVPLEKVYQYEPIPKAIDTDKAGHVLGLQAQLWCEYIPNPQHLEYMAYPRAAALAEIGWSPKSSKDYDHFLARLRRHIKRLQAMQINYRPLD